MFFVTAKCCFHLKKAVPLHDFFLFKYIPAVGLLLLNFYEVKKTPIHIEIYKTNVDTTVGIDVIILIAAPEAFQILR